MPGSAASSTSGAAAPPAPTSTGILGALKSAVAPSNPFEGEIAFTVTDAGHPAGQTMQVQFKGGKIRFNAEGKTGGHMGAGIMDLKNKKLLTIMDAQKKYMEFDFNDATSAAMMSHGVPGAPGAMPGAPSSPPKVEKTGKHETVAGHDCEDWTMTDADGRHGTVCMAKDLGGLDFAGLSGGTPLLASYFSSGPFDGTEFPLKFADYDAQNKEKMRAEVTKIDKKAMDDALFQPPAGYTKLDLGNLGAFGGMGGHGGGMPPGMPPGMPH
jgi:hypothetical protein